MSKKYIYDNNFNYCDIIDYSAIFSEDEIYRYSLMRKIGDGNKIIAFIGLNPSTADDIDDDPTIRRLKCFTSDFGYDKMIMLNIFSYRSTDPRLLYKTNSIIGKYNNEIIKYVCNVAGLSIACWGNHGKIADRGNFVKHMIKNLRCFGITKKGFPKHPLYISKNTKIIDYNKKRYINYGL